VGAVRSIANGSWSTAASMSAWNRSPSRTGAAVDAAMTSSRRTKVRRRSSRWEVCRGACSATGRSLLPLCYQMARGVERCSPGGHLGGEHPEPERHSGEHDAVNRLATFRAGDGRDVFLAMTQPTVADDARVQEVAAGSTMHPRPHSLASTESLRSSVFLTTSSSLNRTGANVPVSSSDSARVEPPSV
jgi:hypothetical protein